MKEAEANPAKGEVTRLLCAIGDGDQQAVTALLPLVYDELRTAAQRLLRQERADHTLQPTALVHEAYLRLVDQSEQGWESRRHFFGVAAKAMRRVLVDHARSHTALKRGGGRLRLSLDESALPIEEASAYVEALDEALGDLSAIDEQKSRIVELRFFGGLTTEEAAEALDVSTRTVERDWRLAKAWLHRAICTE